MWTARSRQTILVRYEMSGSFSISAPLRRTQRMSDADRLVGYHKPSTPAVVDGPHHCIMLQWTRLLAQCKVVCSSFGINLCLQVLALLTNAADYPVAKLVCISLLWGPCVSQDQQQTCRHSEVLHARLAYSSGNTW